MRIQYKVNNKKSKNSVPLFFISSLGTVASVKCKRETETQMIELMPTPNQLPAHISDCPFIKKILKANFQNHVSNGNSVKMQGQLVLM